MTTPKLLFFAALVAGCTGNATVESEPGPNPNPQETHVDLIACGLPLSCDAVCAHLGPGDCGGGEQALECAGALWLSGEAGTLLSENRPGPGNWMGDTFIALLGDGTALRQSRARSCSDGASFCDLAEQPWQIDAQEMCNVAAPDPDCTDTSCPRFPVLEDCAPLDPELSCAELQAELP